MMQLLQLPVLKVCSSMLSGHCLSLVLCTFTPHPRFFLGANKENGTRLSAAEIVNTCSNACCTLLV